MKKLLFLIWILYIIAAIFFIKIFYLDKKETKIEDSIVIIVPEEKLIQYKNNPKWLFEEYKEFWIWAWFFISDDWKIQTVNHIVENDNINYKIIYNNKEYDSVVLSRNKENDLAVLKILWLENKNFIPLKSQNNSKKIIIWENIISYWININNLTIISNTWTLINKKSKLENMSNLLEIFNPLKPGFSGWPIINSDWKIIWINYATSEWKNYGIILPSISPQ